MEIDLANLPEDAQALKALVQQLVGTVKTQGLKIAQLEARIAKLKRMQFGQSSEKLAREIEQLELELDALHEEEASAAARRPAAVQKLIEKPYRKPLPEHLPREEEVHEPACACPNCGGALRRLGEDVTEVLEYVPAAFKVIRHVRPKLSCRVCETIVQAPMPSLPIERGRPAPGCSPMCWSASMPTTCRSTGSPRSTPATASTSSARPWPTGWAGRRRCSTRWSRRWAAMSWPAPSCMATTPRCRCWRRAGKTKTGRLWTYVRDERPHGSAQPPAAVFFYSPDRKGEHPQEHLKTFTGVLHADGYAGFNAVFEAGTRHRGRLLGACPAQVLRRACHQAVADAHGGARSHRCALRHRGDHPRQTAR